MSRNNICGKRIYNHLRYEEKYFALKQYFENDVTLKDLAETFHIGESTVRDWLKRIDFDFKNIERLKRAKVTYDERKKPVYKELADWVKDEILKLIERHPSMGPLKLKQYFYRHHQVVLSEKKIYFFLKESGIIEKRNTRKNNGKKKADRRFEFSSPLAAVQVDLLTIRLSGGQKCYLVTFLDDYSRYILLSELISVKSMEDVIRLLKKVVKKYGIMDHIICDKGSEFVSWQSFTAFEELLCHYDCELIASGPHTPQNQGKLERWHKTFRNDCERNYGGFTLQSEAQLEIGKFVSYYNYERPHQSLKGLTPADRFYGMAEELEKELENYREEQRAGECIYFCCNINGKKMVVSGPRNGELTIYNNISEE